MTVNYHSNFPKLSTPDEQSNAYNRNDNKCVILYYTKNQSVLCDILKDDIDSLPQKYPNALFFEVSVDVENNSADREFHEILTVLPCIKVFKNFSVNREPQLTVNTTPFLTTLNNFLPTIYP
ncbi:hypothetical protein DLAC_00509 [Tieghemostelium lacteum]|uniref:Thioredoxin domain-containing protein n=1 Tax=Tieghemostelium lacteum TaxID=361077 RepID=A0A152AA65_TIELA|nr:hypothetical protein DLAC_00509 [Tieghemostelium lacteum]|eukprot:KYR03021.1 hypothetical protein DLAC_00509 [Tieghemostelium lacteum]